jgi:hypothetical protein
LEYRTDLVVQALRRREDLYKEFAKGPFEPTNHPQLLTKWQKPSAAAVANGFGVVYE